MIILCCTSGTLGDPKLSMITHMNMLATVRSNAGLGLRLLKSDNYLSYVTLAHIFEQLMAANCLIRGMRYCFSRFTGDVWGGPDPQLLMEDI